MENWYNFGMVIFILWVTWRLIALGREDERQDRALKDVRGDLSSYKVRHEELEEEMDVVHEHLARAGAPILASSKPSRR